MSSSVHADNKNKYILILGKGETQGQIILHYQQKQNILLIFHDQKKKFV